MKIFLLTMLIYMLLKRIIHTPDTLSYRVWKNKLVENLKKLEGAKKEIKVKSIESFGTTIVWDVAYICCIIFMIVIYVLYITVYSLTGTKLGGLYLLVMSAIQIILTLYGMKISFGNELFSTNIEDYKFHRIYNFINVIIDYMYYPVAIWMLLA